jgi:hypothetical protein
MFALGTDPHDPRESGRVEVDGKLYGWKIEYYNPSMESGSEDPTDPKKSRRVLTIMALECI